MWGCVCVFNFRYEAVARRGCPVISSELWDWISTWNNVPGQVFKAAQSLSSSENFPRFFVAHVGYILFPPENCRKISMRTRKHKAEVQHLASLWDKASLLHSHSALELCCTISPTSKLRHLMMVVQS